VARVQREDSAEDREIIRTQAYREVFSSPAGRVVLDDLVTFAQGEKADASRALGRADVVLRIHREIARASVAVRAATRKGGSE